MSYQKERAFFLKQFAVEFPTAKYSDAIALLREGTGSQRYNEIACSVDVGERELARLEKRDDNRTKRVAAICKRIGAQLVENGDSRGFPFFLSCPSGRTYDWGQRGLGVPGEGHSGAAIDRMCGQ